MKHNYANINSVSIGKHSHNRSLYHRVAVIFGLLFLFPTIGLVLFGLKHNLMQDEWFLLLFLGIMVSSLLGYSILRQFFDDIVHISSRVAGSDVVSRPSGKTHQEGNELYQIVQAFNAMEGHFATTLDTLKRKSSEISILKELSEICYVTFDSSEILYVTLERSLALVDADVGSVMILDSHAPHVFIVKASIGTGKYAKIDDRIDFETSIAKYAVLNKSPLVVRDIETDRRFGRQNRPQYGARSFICMPIKTSKEIVGVLTISRRKDDRPFVPSDVNVLIPLLSNAAFTYENLRLIKRNKKNRQQLETVQDVFKIINSSFQGSELLHAMLNVIQGIVPFDLAFLALCLPSDGSQLQIYDLLANASTHISKGGCYPILQGTAFDKAIKQDSTLIIEDASTLLVAGEKNIFKDGDKRAAILSPLKEKGVVKGILVIVAPDAEPFFGQQRLIQWLASALSIALERNQLAAYVIQRDCELDSLKQIGRALASSTFDMKKVLSYTMDMIRMIMNVEAGALYLIEESEMELAVAFNVSVKKIGQFRLKKGQGIAGHVAVRGEPLIVNDTAKSPHFFPDIDKSTGFHTRAALCVPMISQGKVIGVLQVMNKKNGGFGDADRDLLQSIASSVSIAIENANLYKETVSMAEHERGIRQMFQKFVPKAIIDQITKDSNSGKELIEEYRTLAMLNVDIRGFSALTRNLGPRKTVSLLNHFFSVMGKIVFNQNGIVDKYLGDGFLALFGAPASSIHDVDHAVNAALEMRTALTELNHYFKKEFNIEIVIGISVHSGEVVVGNFGFEMKVDYTVIGDSVNDLFRLQGMVKPLPNSILISENVRLAASRRLELKEAISPEKLPLLLNDERVFELIGFQSAPC